MSEIQLLTDRIINLEGRLLALEGRPIPKVRRYIKMSEEVARSMVVNYIEANPGCKKTDLYKLSCFSKNKIIRKKQYELRIPLINQELEEDGQRLEVIVAHDGKTNKHIIVG